MKLGDLIVFYPASFLSIIAKTIRTNISDEMKNYISENHLYHCVPNKEVAEKIIDSKYLKPATGIFKNINSYGKAASCMFAGIPNMDSFVKNLSINPYVDPYALVNAIEIDIKKEEINKNYKIRNFSDETVLYEGYCVLNDDRTKIIQLVADLIRDEKENPIIDEKTKKPIGIALRKRTDEEIKESPDKYIPKQDYLEFMKEKKKEFGYIDGNDIISNVYNGLSNIAAAGKLELNEIRRSTNKNFFSTIKSIINRKSAKREQLDENTESKISRIISNRNFLDRKNPYADKKFALAVAKFEQEGLYQYELKDILPEFINSKDGKFLRDRYKQIHQELIPKSMVHGINHSNRVALLSLMIANKEGIIKDTSDREREILTYAAFYHDIGRVLDIGSHAKRSSKLAKNIDFKNLRYKKLSEKDVQLVEMLIEGHEGNDKNVDKLFKKYKIENEDKEMAKKLLFVLKDADALDRSRLTINTPIMTKTNLESKYLRFNTSKKLMNISYELENLTHNVKNYEDILNYKNENKEEHYYEPDDKLRQELRENINLTPDINEKSKEESKDISR